MGCVPADQAFIILALTQVVHSFNMRANHSLFRIVPFSNRKLNLAALFSAILIILVVFIPPIANVFGLIALPQHMYLKAAGLAFIPLPVLEFTKLLGIVRQRHH